MCPRPRDALLVRGRDDGDPRSKAIPARATCSPANGWGGTGRLATPGWAGGPDGIVPPLRTSVVPAPGPQLAARGQRYGFWSQPSSMANSPGRPLSVFMPSTPVPERSMPGPRSVADGTVQVSRVAVRHMRSRRENHTDTWPLRRCSPPNGRAGRRRPDLRAGNAGEGRRRRSSSPAARRPGGPGRRRARSRAGTAGSGRAGS